MVAEAAASEEAAAAAAAEPEEPIRRGADPEGDRPGGGPGGDGRAGSIDNLTKNFYYLRVKCLSSCKYRMRTCEHDNGSDSDGELAREWPVNRSPHITKRSLASQTANGRGRAGLPVKSSLATSKMLFNEGFYIA